MLTRQTKWRTTKTFPLVKCFFLLRAKLQAVRSIYELLNTLYEHMPGVL